MSQYLPYVSPPLISSISIVILSLMQIPTFMCNVCAPNYKLNIIFVTPNKCQYLEEVILA